MNNMKVNELNKKINTINKKLEHLRKGKRRDKDVLNVIKFYENEKEILEMKKDFVRDVEIDNLYFSNKLLKIANRRRYYYDQLCATNFLSSRNYYLYKDQIQKQIKVAGYLKLATVLELAQYETEHIKNKIGTLLKITVDDILKDAKFLELRSQVDDALFVNSDLNKDEKQFLTYFYGLQDSPKLSRDEIINKMFLTSIEEKSLEEKTINKLVKNDASKVIQLS